MAPKGKSDEQRDQYIELLGRAKNSLSMGIVGLPNVGKSLTFSVLTKVQVPSENYPFCTIDPNHARVAVPDKRFEWLCEHFKPKSRVSTFLDITDIAGLIKGASEGKGLGNAFLSHVKAVDGIYHVVRVFPDEDVSHVEGDVNPTRDLEIITTELIAKDLEFLGGRIADAERKAERGIDKVSKELLPIYNKIRDFLREGKDLFVQSWTNREVEVLNELQLLNCKPIVYLLNMSESDYCKRKNKHLVAIQDWIKMRNPNAHMVPYSAKLEATLLELGSVEAQTEYLNELKSRYKLPEDVEVESALDRIIKTGYKALNLCHFFTCGPDEVRCWTIRKYTKAPDAAGVIHTDFRDMFICAEVYTYKDLKKLGSEQEVRAAGKVRTEGKGYIVEDGDIIFFKHNARGGASKKK
ncbi:GTP dependent nucleic acid binding protein [Giardia muris]|uniref:Obg-like ATPase 1 n=1 Tax=Giardia muris TaxID=5742 RepID=A0A4Z1T051_GIAMU|nr:GTP dependent nucleic acid binding protein [Giardia muris]|eukprot:TNJ27273.1 GTP dependent nucleic acid binding protein [Giardia muris]